MSSSSSYSSSPLLCMLAGGGAMVVDSDCSPALSTLLCQEDGGCLGEESDGSGVVVEETEMGLFGEGEDDGYMEVLVAREGSFERRVGEEMVVGDGDWLVCARREAVRWILKTRACFGFSFRTAYLSVTYLDRFFVRRTVETRQSWAIQLLSIACLSLAAKMEECRVPLLTEFRLGEYHFNGNAIQRMELLVLTTLGWRMGSVTPFPYLSYLASKLECKLQRKELLFGATEVIFTAIEKLNLVVYRPSSIATAAFFVTSGQELTKKWLESETGINSICGSSEIKHVLSCYDLLQEMQIKKLKLGKNITSKDDISSANPSINGSLDNFNETISSTIIGTKRRKLDLNA